MFKQVANIQGIHLLQPALLLKLCWQQLLRRSGVLRYLFLTHGMSSMPMFVIIRHDVHSCECDSIGNVSGTWENGLPVPGTWHVINAEVRTCSSRLAWYYKILQYFSTRSAILC